MASVSVVMKKTGTFSTFYQNVEIWRSEKEVEFRVAGAVHAWYHRDRFLTGLAWDLIAAAPLLGASGPPRSILMLGLAGGTSFRILRHLLPDCRLVAVDIDAELVGLARNHMHLDELEAEVVIADAYEWLEGNSDRFDVVIDDIYLAGADDVYRPYDADRGKLQILRGALAPEGLLAVNLVTGKGHRKIQTETRNLLKRHHRSVRSLTTPGAQNEVLVAGHAVAPAGALRAYSDSFVARSDREYWAQIRSRKLG